MKTQGNMGCVGNIGGRAEGKTITHVFVRSVCTPCQTYARICDHKSGTHWGFCAKKNPRTSAEQQRLTLYAQVPEG